MRHHEEDGEGYDELEDDEEFYELEDSAGDSGYAYFFISLRLLKLSLSLLYYIVLTLLV